MSEDNMKKYLANDLEKVKKRTAFEEAIKQQLRTEERFQQYFAQYDEKSVETFIEHYAKQKAYWYNYVTDYWHLTKNKQSKWYDMAKKAINAIAKKKVYNQYCAWLNGEVKYVNIDIAIEWDEWLENPLYFKYAEIITQAEVDTYISYINQLDEALTYEDRVSAHWHTPKNATYESDKEYDDEDLEFEKYEHYSRWFRYYDEVFGTEHVRRVSLQRFEKERYYSGYIKKLEEAKQPPPPPAAPPKYIPPIDYEEMLAYTAKYVKQYESYENQMAYEGWWWHKKRCEFTERVEPVIYELEEATEYVPVQDNDDWREGLKLANEQHIRSKVIEAIMPAYEEYLYLLENELGFEDWIEKEDPNYEEAYIQERKANILAARKLLNEPEDFNF